MAILYTSYIWNCEVYILPLFFVALHIGASMSSYFASIITNKIKRVETIFILGITFLIMADVLFILCTNNLLVTILAMFFLGAYSGIAGSVFPAQISLLLPENLRGTGLGIYNIMCAISILLGSTILGFVSDKTKMVNSFFLSTGVASIALVFMIIYRQMKGRNNGK